MILPAATQQQIDYLLQTDPRYPRSLSVLGNRLPESIATLGNVDVLGESSLALFCSVKCPGNLILKMYDLAQKLRETNVMVIGGFHSPVERECLNVLLKSNNKVIICPARGIEFMRIPAVYRQPLSQGRLLFLSPFSEKQRQGNAMMAERRNRFVAALSARVFVAHAAPGSKTERLCGEIIGWRKPLFTFESEATHNLLTIGATALRESLFADPPG
jgi:predicted Rossmann fold nucleotide-binding protein DprA/Smf involved in DNA uptake